MLGRDELTGVVAEGKQADLVLLNGDPRDNIGNTKKIAGVIRRGQWLPAEVLQKGLDELAARHARGNRKHFKVMHEVV